MKKTLCSLLVLAAAQSASAGVVLDLRTDYKSVGEYDSVSNLKNSTAAAKTTNAESSQFQVSRARIKFDAEAAPGLKVYSRLDLRAATNTAQSKDTTNNLVEYAYISHDVNSFLNVEAGKLAALTGGFENDYNGGDLYFFTHAGGVLNGLIGGVSLNFKPAENHMVALTVGNNEGASNTKTGSGVFYRGGVMDNKLNIAAHYYQTYNGAQDAEKKINTSSFSLKYTGVTGLTVDLEYLGSYKEAGSSGKETDSTVYTGIKYMFGKMAVVGRIESSSHKVDGVDTKSFDRTGMGLALEYYPVEGKDNFRYHVAYNNFSDKFKATVGGEDKFTMSEMFVGMKLQTDIAGK